MPDSFTPTLAEVLTSAVDMALGRVYVALPGIVQSYDPTTRTATVRPAIHRPALLEDATYEIRALPVLAEVPVVFPGSGGFSISFPLEKGDSVLLVFCDYPAGPWRRNAEPSDPEDIRAHSIAGAIAIPGLLTSAASTARPTTDHLVLEKMEGASIHVAEVVRLGSASANDFVALASKVDANFDAIKNALAAPNPVAGGAGGAVSIVVSTSPVAAAKVTAE